MNTNVTTAVLQYCQSSSAVMMHLATFERRTYAHPTTKKCVLQRNIIINYISEGLPTHTAGKVTDVSTGNNNQLQDGIDPLKSPSLVLVTITKTF